MWKKARSCPPNTVASNPPVCPVRPIGAAVNPCDVGIPASLGSCADTPDSEIYQSPPLSWKCPAEYEAPQTP